jgi:hypothetical protein
VKLPKTNAAATRDPTGRYPEIFAACNHRPRGAAAADRPGAAGASRDPEPVTGSQVVQLDFYPGTPVNLVKTDLSYYQIPTLPSPTQQLMSSLDTAAQDLPALIKRATATFDRMEKIVSPENAKAVSNILASAASMMKTLEGRCVVGRGR